MDEFVKLRERECRKYDKEGILDMVRSSREGRDPDQGHLKKQD